MKNNKCNANLFLVIDGKCITHIWINASSLEEEEDTKKWLDKVQRRSAWNIKKSMDYG